MAELLQWCSVTIFMTWTTIPLTEANVDTTLQHHHEASWRHQGHLLLGQTHLANTSKLQTHKQSTVLLIGWFGLLHDADNTSQC